MATAFGPPVTPTPAATTEPASTGRRIGGGLIDVLILSVVGAIFVAAFGESDTGDGSASFSITGVPALLMFLAWLAYYIGCEAAWGRTVGKMALGMRVVQVDGTKAPASAVAVRNLLRIVDGIFLYLVAVVAIASSPRNQRLGDMAAKTLVVRDPR